MQGAPEVLSLRKHSATQCHIWRNILVLHANFHRALTQNFLSRRKPALVVGQNAHLNGRSQLAIKASVQAETLLTESQIRALTSVAGLSVSLIHRGDS